MFIKQITILIYLLLKITPQDTTPNELRYYLHFDDIYSVRISDLLNYKNFLDDLTIEKSSKDIIINDPVPILEFENESLWENEEGFFISKKPVFKITKIYDSADYQNFNSYLIKTKEINNLLIISEIIKEKNLKKIIIKNRIVQFVDPSFICDEILMDKDHIYSSCISLRDNNIQLCKKNYLLNTVSSCRIFNLDFELKNDQLKTSELGIQVFTNTDGIKIYFMYFRKSLILNYQKKIILITDESYIILEVPIQEFVIDDLQVLSYRKEREIITCLITNFKGQYTELYSLKIERGLIDKEHLAEGLIKDNIIHFDYYERVVLFYEEDPEANQIIMTELHLESLTDRVIKIPGQKQVLRTDLGCNIAIMQSRNDHFMKSVFFYDISTERIFESKVKLHDHDQWSVISVYDKNMFLIFDQNEMNFKIYNIISLRSIQIENPKNIDKAYITFKVKGQTVLNLNLRYIKFDSDSAPATDKYKTIKSKYNTVKLNGLMNDMVVKSKNNNFVEYFNQLKVFYPQEDDCDSSKTFFVNDLFVFFCLDDTILLYSFIELDNQSIKLIKPKFFETNKKDFDKIRSIRFYNNHLLLILDNDFKLSAVAIDKNNLTENNKLIFSTVDLKNDYNECEWNQQGLICFTETDVYHVSINYQKGLLTTTITETIKRKNIHGSKNNFYNSYYNRSAILKLLYDKFFKEYYFEVSKKNQVFERYNKFLYPITPETQFIYITYVTDLVITKRVGELELFLIHSLSFLKLPVEKYLKNFKEMVLINTYPIDNVFVIFYRTKENTIRALLYKATLEANNRLIKEFLVDDKACKKPTAYSRTYKTESFLISYICSDKGNDVFKVFRHNINGPLLIIKPNQVSDELTYGNELKSKLLFLNPKKNIFIKAKATNVFIGKNKKKTMIYDLEKKNLFIEGDHLYTSVLELPKGVTFLKRTTNLSELELEESLVYKKPYTNIETGIFNDRLMILFGNYFYLNKKIEYNNDYIDCKRITPAIVEEKDSIYFRKIFICRKRDNFVYYFTNFDELNFKIDPEFIPTNILIQKPYIIKRKKFVYLLFAYSDNIKTIKIIKIYWTSRSKILLIFHQDIYCDSYHRKFVGFDAFYPFYDEVKNSILITLHPKYTSEIIILNYSLKENKVDAKDVSYPNLYEGKSLIMYFVRFFTEKDKKFMFAVTNYYIYEVEIVNDYGWKLNIKNKFYNHYGNSKGKEIICYNDKYLVVLINPGEAKVNMLIWKRGSENKSENIFSTIGLMDLQSFGYKIMNLKFVNQNSNQISIIFYEERNPLYEEYKILKLVQVEISTFKLKLDLEKMFYKGDLKLKFNSFNQKNVILNIRITLRENLKTILFGVTFCVLFILLCLLLVLICIVKVKNKELKNELDSMEVDIMSERGIYLGNDNANENVNENQEVIKE